MYDHAEGQRYALTADLAQFFHVNLEDVWAGRLSAGYVLRLVEQLMNVPGSRVRMLASDLSPAHIDWGTNSELLASLWDLQVEIAVAKSGEEGAVPPRYPRPWEKPELVEVVDEPEPVPESTVAQFNVAAFMKELTG